MKQLVEFLSPSEIDDEQKDRQGNQHDGEQAHANADISANRRVRTADRKPAIYSIDSLPADIGSLKGDREFFLGSIYKLLSERGHTVDHARAVLLPVIADKELAKILKVKAGTPLQHLRQLDFDSKGRAVMLSLEWHVPTVIELRVYRRGPGPLANGAG